MWLPRPPQLFPCSAKVGFNSTGPFSGACEAAGVHVRSSAAAALQIDGGAVSAVQLSDGTRLDTSAVVVCTGAWMSELLPVPVFPIKGQMLSLRPPSADQSRTPGRTLFADDCYIIPRRDGRVVVGATEEPSAGFSRAPTAAGTKELLDRALRLVPSLKEYELEETWAGLRPTAPDLVRPPRASQVLPIIHACDT